MLRRLAEPIPLQAWLPVFHIKTKRPGRCLAQGHNKRTCWFVPQPPLNAERQAEKLWIPFFKVFRYDSTRRMNPRPINYEADALTTTQSRYYNGIKKKLSALQTAACQLVELTIL